MSGDDAPTIPTDPPPDGRATDPATLVVRLEGFDGPIDVLLALARDQKVDLARISILHLAEQYLAFVRAARERHLDLAADYLVMAAWLAFLKSRLLLPEPQADDDGPTGAEMAAALQFQLQRLEAMRTAGGALFERPRRGHQVFPRGAPEGVTATRQTVYALTLHDLLRAYAGIRQRDRAPALAIEAFELYSVDEALGRLNRLLGTAMEWTTLARFLPDGLSDPLLRRSALGATFVAGLELARQGRLEMRQEGGAFSPLLIRRKDEQA